MASASADRAGPSEVPDLSADPEDLPVRAVGTPELKEAVEEAVPPVCFDEIAFDFDSAGKGAEDTADGVTILEVVNSGLRKAMSRLRHETLVWTRVPSRATYFIYL
jgi:hypothetical protein